MLGVGGQRSGCEIPRAAFEGGEDNFREKESAPLAVARFLSTLMPNASLKKSQQKPLLLSLRSDSVHQRGQVTSTIAHTLMLFCLASFSSTGDDADQSAHSNSGRALRPVRLCVITPGGPRNIKMCPGHTVGELF